MDYLYFWGYGISARAYRMVSGQQKKSPLERYTKPIYYLAIRDYIAADKSGTGVALV